RDPGRHERARRRCAIAVGVPRDPLHGPHPVHPAARRDPHRAAAVAPPARCAEGGAHMTPQLLAIAMAVVLLIAVILLLRSYVLPEKYAILWLVASVVAIILSAWPGLLDRLSDFFGIAQPINLLFVGAFFVVFLLLMQVTLELARTRDELRKTVQRLALELEKRHVDDDD